MYGVYVALSVSLTVYCQLILKWRLGQISMESKGSLEKIFFLAALPFRDLWIASAFLATFTGAVFWMFAITKLPISIAYPFMSLSFVFVMVGAAWFFGETVSLSKVIGIFFVIAGLMLTTR